jgi:hypothetical protein
MDPDLDCPGVKKAPDSGSAKYCFKDIVQPKKRGVKKVTNRFVLPSNTIADIFFEH